MTVSAELQAHLDTSATTLARCWKIVRRDGVTLGFTDHDRDIAFGGTVFQASTGMDAAALESSTGLSVDNSQAVGALSAIGLTDADILAGRYDGAEVVHWWVNWKQPADRVRVFRGTLGEMRQTGGAFEVELRGLAETLNRPLGRAYLRTCDRALGDAGCGFDLSSPGFSAEDTVVRVAGNAVLFVNGLDGFAPGWFSHGILRWESGANAGLEALIKQDRVQAGVRRIELWQEAALAVQAGDRFRVMAGCDKAAATCRAKFNNFMNFRGFPHIPGEDWVTAYPRSGEVHDGSSVTWNGDDGRG